MSLLIQTSELFEACRIADFDVLEELLTTRDQERHAAAMKDLHSYKEHKTGLTPFLLCSCNTHNSDLVVLLHQHGAKLDQLGLHLETCLHLAARQAREDVLDKLLRMLNDTPVLKKQLIDKRDDEGSTPLMCACFAGDIPCMRLLRENGAFLDQRNYRGQTPLMKAVCFRNQRVLDWLLTAQVDTLLRDNEDKQAVDYAKERDLVGMMEKISGKTMTDELDRWVDEKAHLTGALGTHQKESQIVKRQPTFAEIEAMEVQAALEEAQSLAALDTFSSTYESSEQPSLGNFDTMSTDYSYTPLPIDATDPYQVYEESQIDQSWQEFMDYENDAAYWFNSLTNESTYERPWSLGGPIDHMDPNVATAKAALFKSMLSNAKKEKVEGKTEEDEGEKVEGKEVEEEGGVPGEVKEGEEKGGEEKGGEEKGEEKSAVER